jgi:peptidoglycan/LPS O-acetylase OafA/YrhL
LAKHITRASLFTSNFLLLRESGYFDTSAELKPLLHLWSLSIEEQFYLFFPILIITFKKTIHVKLITTILVLSFFYNIFWINYSPKEVFYLPYTRIWEILVGVLLAWMTNANKPIKSLIPENLLSVIGIILILFGLFIFNKDTQYPSYYATLPVLGTGLLIFAGQNSYINKKLLSINILVYIGLISFPWYLWHWPLLSIFQIIYGERPPSIVIILIVLVSLFLAILSYHFLEKPIRSSSSPSRKKFIFILLTLMALLSMISY